MDGRRRARLWWVCSQAARIAPQYARNYRSWGDSLVNLGRMEPAVTRYRKAIELQPAFGPARLKAVLNALGVRPRSVDCALNRVLG